MKAMCVARRENIGVEKWLHICECVSDFEAQGYALQNKKRITDEERKFRYNENYAYVLEGKGEVVARVLDFVVLLTNIEYLPYEFVDYNGE